jgi:hypothetical protein
VLCKAKKAKASKQQQFMQHQVACLVILLASWDKELQRRAHAGAAAEALVQEQLC